MTAPRHLWSGDWERESAAAADELARRQARADEPSFPPRPSASKPPTSSAAVRALARVRGLRARGAVVIVLAMLLSGGAAFAAVSALVRSDSAQTSNTHPAGSPARAVAPAWLGVETITFPSAGAMVGDVVPGSPADVAGLQPGDVITQIGNRAVRTSTDLEAALRGMHAGQQIEIRYDRGPLSGTAQVTLRARPANGP